ncbi:hypothetical protein CD30_13830 [Ureibacillus massiliensis 4400831 = CIP 108448 = CCUG 49529]|uniref:O-antigen ligase-related domain-containing protein n=1 Tax=Ureibacillus massiliensis 4400831 = CIP 108448 = CCUG 49529 TaxID=1211035 RepID=A0A0A3J2U4_9BACL|nr:O-antigen ligase family protein [Ureibacillus massiliensis]KGR90050.1 hypothetical protein CD30_13830 [Ureibacillus massiliensis 4400831 = CIP 108448 = CCUG 49529]
MTSFYGEYREKNIISDEEGNRISRETVDKWIFRLFLVLIGFMPLIVLGHVEEVVSPLVSDTPLLNSGIKGDLFTHYKSVVTITITVMTSLLLLAKIFFMGGTIRKTILNYFIGGMTLIIVVSTILSPTITIAANGLYNRSDGAFTWICYMALLFIAINVQYPKKAVHYIIYSLYPFILINFFITTMNFSGNDLLNYNITRAIISLFLPEGTNISGGSILLGTLNHFNYMSGTFIIMSMICIVWVLIDTNKIRKIINFIIALIAMATMLMAMSASGFVTFICITPLLIWIAIKSCKKVTSFIYLALFYCITAIIIHILASINPEAWDESIGFFGLEGLYSMEQPESVSYNGNDYGLDLLGSTVHASDGEFTLPVLPESAWSAGTGRVYIWEETLKLVQERPLFGYGLDSLVYHFPHNNLEARGNLAMVTIVDKPHSLYVGTLFGTGILGLVGFLGIVILTAWVAVREIFKFNTEKILLLPLCIAWIAFLIQSFINDSLPGTTGMMFTIIGIVMGILYSKEEVTSK